MLFIRDFTICVKGCGTIECGYHENVPDIPDSGNYRYGFNWQILKNLPI